MSSVQPTNAISAEIRSLILALADDSQSPIAVLDERKTVLLVAGNWSSLALINPAGRTLRVGGTFAEFLPQELCVEQEVLIDKAALVRGVQRLIGFVNGRVLCCTFRSIRDHGSENLVLVSMAPVQSGELANRMVSDIEVHQAQQQDFGPLAPLTMRQLDVFRLMGLGFIGPEIASRIHRSIKTVDFHRNAIRERLQVNSIADIALLAHRSGIVHFPFDLVVEWRHRDINGSDTDPVGRDEDQE